MTTCTKPAGKKRGRRSARERRNEIVTKHLPLVKHVLDRLAYRLPRHVDREDLLEAGVLGLLDAADRFDPKRNVRFSTYAISRIRGAMIDALRDEDWLPRSMRSEITLMKEARAELEQENSRPPTMKELSERTGVRERKLQKLACASTNSCFQSLDTVMPSAVTEDHDPLSTRHDPAAHPAERAILVEDKQRLAGALLKLPDTERLVITLYYFENLRLHDIAKVLRVTDSRVCQIHRATLKHLHEMMAEPEPLLAPAGVESAEPVLSDPWPA